MYRWLSFIVLTALCAAIPCHHARADTRVTVHDFYGPGAQRMRADVLSLLERQSGVTIVTQGQIDSTARRLGVDPFSPEGRRSLSRELQLSAWLTGMVKRRPGRLTLTLLVFDGAEHARIGRTQLTGSSVRQLSAKIRGQLWGKTERAILSAAAPAQAAKSPIDEPQPMSGQVDMVVTSEQAETNRARSQLGASRDALRVFLGVGSPYRSLAYRDAVTSTLGDYQLSGAPMADVQLAFFPARLVTDGWASWFGLDARALLALSTPTRDQAGGALKSRYDAFHVGLRARIPVGLHAVSVFSGYAVSHFTVTPQTASFTSPTPSVDYRSIRSGLGGELTLGESARIGLDAAYLSYLEVGEIGRWFPRATAGGLELGLFGTYAITSAIQARVSAAYQRTFFDFHARPGDKNIAGGALDQYLSLSLGAGVAL